MDYLGEKGPLTVAWLLAFLLVAAAAFGIGASLECDCEKRARREREGRKRALDTLADREVKKMHKKGWL